MHWVHFNLVRWMEDRETRRNTQEIGMGNRNIRCQMSTIPEDEDFKEVPSLHVVGRVLMLCDPRCSGVNSSHLFRRIACLEASIFSSLQAGRAELGIYQHYVQWNCYGSFGTYCSSERFVCTFRLRASAGVIFIGKRLPLTLLSFRSICFIISYCSIFSTFCFL